MDTNFVDEVPDSTPIPAQRAWLAALLLREQSSWLDRFTARLAQLNSLGRGQRRRLQRKAAVSLAGAALVLSLGAGMLAQPSVAHAAAITVSTHTANGFVVDGFCSLSEAIVNANNDAQTYTDCATGSGADVITLAGNTYNLQSYYGSLQTRALTGLPSISSEITIEGNGATITRDSNATEEFRILAVDATGNLTLNDTTISGGEINGGSGAGILNAGTLNLVRDTVTNNNELYYESGGGIDALEGSNTSISYSTISNNSAYFGGALESEGEHLTIENSTVSGNYSVSFGVIELRNGTNEIQSSTITGNGSSYYTGGITGGGDALTIENSIISGNTTWYYNGTEINLGNDTVVTSNHNVLGSSQHPNDEAFSGFTPSATDFNATSDHNNVALSDILNTTLANNGGPTMTHALVSNSPAIDFAPNSGCSSAPLANDQRGLPRNVDIPGTGNDSNSTVCDAGAFEVQPVVVDSFCPVDPAVGNTLTDVIGTYGGRTSRLNVPNYQDLNSLYGQLAAVNVGQINYTRFLYPNHRNVVKIVDPTSPAFRGNAVSWWGSSLTPSKYIIGQFRLGRGGAHSPRAFLLWPTYNTDAQYANVFVKFDDSSKNYVAWQPNFTPTQTQVVTIPETQADGATVVVHLAIVDNNKDNRPILTDVTVGSQTQSNADTNPNTGNALNLYDLTFTNVPAGVNHVTITITSPNGTGDSAAIIGAAVNYECAIP